MNLKMGILVPIFLVFLIPFAFAASTAQTDKLNYYATAENHTVSITNNEGATTNYTIVIPSGWTAYNETGDCTIHATQVNCSNVADSNTVSYILENPTTGAEYAITTVSTCGGTTNDVKFIKINPDEIFYTLVEYGRGRGNYFYSSAGDTGYKYLPNGTTFELNYLHKVFNIKQYYGLATALAENATWTCTYPNDTVVRQHLVTSTSRDALWTAAYNIDEIEGSWERMGYLGQHIDSGTYDTGKNLTINCTNIVYTLSDVGGNISIDEDSFELQIRNREPVAASASTTSTIGNGTQEVEITYTINNSEVYPIDSVMIEIQSPQYATFIGTRGELWGTGRDKFIMERPEIAASGSESITLVARFNTSAAPDISSLALSRGIKAKYIPTWEANAYNPQEYIQTISASGIGNATVSMATAAAIVNLQNRINAIYSLVIDTNATARQINSTANIIETLVVEINITTHLINDTLYDTVIPNLTTIIGYTDTLEDRIDDLEEYLNCTTMPDQSICHRLALIQNYTDTLETEVNDTQNLITDVNISLQARFDAVDVNLTEIDNTLAGVLGNISNLDSDVQALVNCTATPDSPICTKLDNITSITTKINTTLTTVLGVVDYINVTRWGDLTAQDLNDSITTTITNTNTIITKVRQLREFQEEVVFLITDSYGLQEDAKRKIAEGDAYGALESLKEANNKLKEATDRLVAIQAEAQAELQASPEQPVAATTKTNWVPTLLGVILGACIIFYYVSRRRN